MKFWQYVTDAVTKNFGKFHDIQLTYELLTADWAESKYYLFRTGANLRCYGYIYDIFIKVKLHIIPKLHNWIESNLLFENMHYICNFAQDTEELQAKATNFLDKPRTISMTLLSLYFLEKKINKTNYSQNNSLLNPFIHTKSMLPRYAY